MLSFYLRLCITTAVVVLIVKFVPEIKTNNLEDTIFFGLILGVVNAFIRPLITLVTVPINLFTLGLFSLVINTFTFWLAAEITVGVEATSWKGALIGGGVIWIISVLSSLFVREDII
jgi:putative membrane protein